MSDPDSICVRCAASHDLCTCAQAAPFKPQEVAYRTPGRGGWKRRDIKTQAALKKLLARLDADAEVRFRNLEES